MIVATANESVLATGRVLQVNVSAGGVPKLPVERAFVNRFGLEGDRHNDFTMHGGPHRAVCLFAMEVIERLQAEGHPIEPGGAGENLTTWGVEWSLLPIGSKVRVGSELELELASPTAPCAYPDREFQRRQFQPDPLRPVPVRFAHVCARASRWSRRRGRPDHGTAAGC